MYLNINWKKRKGLRSGDLVTNNLGDVTSTHRQIQVLSDTLKYIPHHHDMSLMYLNYDQAFLHTNKLTLRNKIFSQQGF